MLYAATAATSCVTFVKIPVRLANAHVSKKKAHAREKKNRAAQVVGQASPEAASSSAPQSGRWTSTGPAFRARAVKEE